MAINADEVRVAGTGRVFTAPKGTALPTTVDTALPATWNDLGYVTTDGVSFTFSRETEDLAAWQGDKIRVLSLSEPKMVEFTLMQTDAAVLQNAFGGGTIATVGAVTTYTPPARGENVERAMCIEFVDGDITYRYAFGRVQQEGDVNFVLTREGAVEYPVTFGVLEATPAYTIITNDPGMASADGGDDDAVAKSSLKAPSMSN